MPKSKRIKPYRPPGKGYVDDYGRKKVAVAFEDPKVYERIRRMAIAEHKTMSAMIYELVKVGLLDLEESDKEELPLGEPAPVVQ